MALLVAISRMDSGAAVAERTFGKEARARGVTFGSAPDNDVVVESLTANHARLVRRDDGYYYEDVGRAGFEVAEAQLEPGSDFRISAGSSLVTNGLKFEFKRSTAQRPEPVPHSTAVVEKLPREAMNSMRELSRFFLGESSFQTEEEMRRFNALLKLTLEIAMEWMGRALRGRAEFQDQFSAPVTQIYTRALNPLKRMQDISSIANFLLDWREERDIESIRDTLREVFTDMVKHQMGMLGGFQEVLSDLQKKLDPQAIEAEAGGGLMSGKKSWQRYCELYAETFEESSKLFNDLIYPSIRKGYIFSHDDLLPETKPNKGDQT
jgi:predicted component of type VI protein secretion system